MLSTTYLSIYIHIPFCRWRCNYCDFNTYAGCQHLIKPYVSALVAEIEYVSRTTSKSKPVHTIYLGGGTPNLLTAEEIKLCIEQIQKSFDVVAQPEISMEMNPHGLSKKYLSDVKACGVNRLSLGMQSALLEELRLLGRRHTFADTSRSVELARQAGFENINIDIIFGLPAQAIHSLRKTLEAALELEPPHLSLYALTVEEGTPLASMIKRGILPPLDDDTVGDMYAMAMEKLEKEGYIQYEISNWALDQAHECQHNLQYWRNEEYVGFGAGAHSHYMNYRWENAEGIRDYIEMMATYQDQDKSKFFSPAALRQSISSFNDQLGETMMMGLRLTDEGISARKFEERFGATLEKIYGNEITFLCVQGLLIWVEKEDGKHLKLTPRGRMLGNQVFMQFLKD